MNSLYGRYRTRTFCEVFPDKKTFRDALVSCGLSISLTEESITNLYYLLYAQYGNSHIASSDENQFKYKLYSIVYRFGGLWQRKLEVIKRLQELSEDDITNTGKFISSHAYNPGEYGTSIDNNEEELTYINEQNKSINRGSIINSYSNYMSQLIDPTSEFIDMFKVLFITIVQPEKPLLYEMDELAEDYYSD